MSFLFAIGFFAAAVILWRFVHKASALSPPPLWVCDDAVFMAIAPLVTLLGALGMATLINGLVHADTALIGSGALAFGVELLVVLAVFAVLWLASAPAKGGVALPHGDQLIDAQARVGDVAPTEAGAANDPRTPPGRSPRRAA
jgi:hypothetical protein